MIPGLSVDVPIFAAIDASGLDRLIRKWLNKPNIRRVTLVSFAFQPDLKFSDTPLINKLCLLAPRAEVTVVTADPRTSRIGSTSKRLWHHIGVLSKSGVSVFLHRELHAKVYLFEEPNRVCWAVGSSNLTQGGLLRNEELSLRGYRFEDYSIVRKTVCSIISDAYQA